jgi:hypothetical protein
MIKAAEVRATISQIERYQTAVNTFRGKYNDLPGDMPPADASQFGFASRTGAPGAGDGNGVLEGWQGGTGILCDYCETPGSELYMFWTDLSTANLIDGSFMPAAKIGRGNLVYVVSVGGVNYFGIAVITTIYGDGTILHPPAGFIVQEAYSIDKKIDDGLPQTGRVLAGGINNNEGIAMDWSASPSSTSCYDTTSAQYSLTQNNGSGINCHLSFQFQ